MSSDTKLSQDALFLRHVSGIDPLRVLPPALNDLYYWQGSWVCGIGNNLLQVEF